MPNHSGLLWYIRHALLSPHINVYTCFVNVHAHVCGVVLTRCDDLSEWNAHEYNYKVNRCVCVISVQDCTLSLF